MQDAIAQTRKQEILIILLLLLFKTYKKKPQPTNQLMYMVKHEGAQTGLES